MDSQKYFKNSRSGFTLVETIIYVAIIGGIISTFISFGFNISNARNKVYSQQEVQANARTAIDIISQKIRSANSVSTTQSVFDVNPGILYLVMSSSTLNPTIISLSGINGQLQVKEGNNATNTITTNRTQISSLIFTNLSASNTRENIGVNMTIQYITSSDVNYNFVQNLQTAVSLRE